jgi:hypothetical protein
MTTHWASGSEYCAANVGFPAHSLVKWLVWLEPQ